MDVTAEFRIEFAQTFLQLQYPTLRDDLGEDSFFHAVIVFEHTARETDYKTHVMSLTRSSLQQKK